MKLSDGEKLILTMLCDIYKKLNIDGEVDPEFISNAIFSGDLWAVKRNYPGIFDGKEPPVDVIQETENFLYMWSIIESSYSKLPEPEKEKVKTENFDMEPEFPGFDGNHEADHMGVARLLTEQLGNFASLGMRATKNSGMPRLPGYRRMHEVFRAFHGKTNGFLPADALIEILRGRRHPEVR